MDFKISIIIPVYNLENYIERTLDSVCSQMTRDVELLIINDGSVDNSLEKINNYLESKNIDGVSVFTGENQGLVAARNKGISKSKGEYLFFLDGDDVVFEGTISSVLEILNSKSPDALIGKYQKINTEGRILYNYDDKYITPKPEDITSNFILEQCLLKNIVMVIGTVFYSRKVIDSIELIFGDKNFKGAYGEEIEFYFRFLTNSTSITFLDVNILGYTARDNSLISTIDKPIEVLQNYITRMMSLKNELSGKVPNNTLRLFDSTFLPGLILSLSIYSYYNEVKVPRDIINRLKYVSIKDTILKKKRRGLGLYFGSLALYLSPVFFVTLLKILKIKNRF
ncbi:glycosyltransferase family 2 protein [Bizionia saleffrena]|uniref:Glycosyltransferase family 2 protein n=1 Tax=Bizionia saleffrena TaxID=291189 RepID=A0A8H2LE43_9FLAO|nr:glycosyltransferase family 2 protein [Bizionia saleffrena]TYB74195.1 glycosyltransferase family 2 protein [Bizionia saleffrena]